MRERFSWIVALIFLLVALYAVGVRREVYDIGREIGDLEEQLRETSCRNENLALVRERLLSPSGLVERADEAGIVVLHRAEDADR